MNKNPTILGQMEKGSGFTAGFDYVRTALALAVLVWHSYILSAGSAALYRAAWSGPFRFLLAIILPMFFALSGFLVAGSLERTRAHQFVVLRALRLIPALAVEVTLSALILGAFFTTLPLWRLSDKSGSSAVTWAISSASCTSPCLASLSTTLLPRRSQLSAMDHSV